MKYLLLLASGRSYILHLRHQACSFAPRSLIHNRENACLVRKLILGSTGLPIFGIISYFQSSHRHRERIYDAAQIDLT